MGSSREKAGYDAPVPVGSYRILRLVSVSPGVFHSYRFFPGSIKDLCRYTADPQQTVVYFVILVGKLFFIGKLLKSTSSAGSCLITFGEHTVRGILFNGDKLSESQIFFYLDYLYTDYIPRKGILDKNRITLYLCYSGAIRRKSS